MIDFVFPKNNEKEFIDIAEKLGIDELCFVYKNSKDIPDIPLQKVKTSFAIICAPEDVRKHKGKYITIVKSPEDHTKLRGIIENLKPDILYGLEFHRKKDFIHHRASGLNHVMAKIAKEKEVAIGFDISALIRAKPKDCALAIGRMMQNIHFARKFKFKVVIASFTDNPWHLRSSHDTKALFMSLGMTASEAKTALQGVTK